MKEKQMKEEKAAAAGSAEIAAEKALRNCGGGAMCGNTTESVAPWSGNAFQNHPGLAPSLEISGEQDEPGNVEQLTGHDAAFILALHNRILLGESAAPNELAECLLRHLVIRTQRHFPWTDEQMVWDAVTATLMDYLEKPSRFDPSRKATLDRYLFRIGCNDLRDILRSEKRRKRREEQFTTIFLNNFVELCPSAAHIRVETKIQMLTEIVNELSDLRDRRGLGLWMAGEWRGCAFALALGLKDVPFKTQQKTIKQWKDRMVKKIQRVIKQRCAP